MKKYAEPLTRKIFLDTVKKRRDHLLDDAVTAEALHYLLLLEQLIQEIEFNDKE